MPNESAAERPTARTVPGFLASTVGLPFGNRFEPGPLLRLGFGPVRLPIGRAEAGLCGGMALEALDRWSRRTEPGAAVPAAPEDTAASPPTAAAPDVPSPPTAAGAAEPPRPGSPLFRRLVRRQIASFGWGIVPIRFWLAGLPWRSEARRANAVLGVAWPRIRADIDAGRPSLVGLVRVLTVDPRRLASDHQVVAYGYEIRPGAAPGQASGLGTDAVREPAGRPGPTIRLRIYDPNHPLDDSLAVELLPGPTAADPLRIGYLEGEGPVFALLRLATVAPRS